ncbi:MAG: extracellular solute-binding protein [Acetobacteraceae bacterium]|nr:extracellular solute-binding protein [Acetobacteraceae bacterium]
MTRIPSLVLLAMTAMVSVGQARDLTVVGFGGGFQENARKHLFQGFAASSGQPVKDDVYDGEQARIAAMVKTRDVTWDVVMVEAPEMIRGCEDGLYEKIDWTVVNRAKFIPNGTATCGAGAVGWGVALFYDKKRIGDGPMTYAQFWDTKQWPGKRLLRNSAKTTLEIALLADGVSRAELYKILATRVGQDRAFAKLDAIKPDLMWWKSGAQPLQLVGSGDVAFAVGFVGRTARAAQDGAAYPLLWQTLLFSFDFWTVVKGSPNTPQAMKLIDYMTDAAPLRDLAKDWAVSPATAAVSQDPEVRAKNPAMVAEHAEEGMFIDTEFWVQYGDDLERRFAAWVAR